MTPFPHAELLEGYQKADAQRYRVLIDNDFSGDPDGLFQLVHHLLCDSVDVVGLIGSHLGPGDVTDASEHSARNAVHEILNILELMDLTDSIPAYEGAPHALHDSRTPIASAASAAIITEARRDVESRLFYAAGGGLTDIASALLAAPDIASRLTVVWIGGDDGSDDQRADFNLHIDRNAAQYVLCESEVEVWQIPLSTYVHTTTSMAELRARVGSSGTLGAFLMERLDRTIEVHRSLGRYMGETYALGDSPLVLATALQPAFSRRPPRLEDQPVRELDETGRWRAPIDGRSAKVIRSIDSRLLLEDFYAKLDAHVAGAASASEARSTARHHLPGHDG